MNLSASGRELKDNVTVLVQSDPNLCLSLVTDAGGKSVQTRKLAQDITAGTQISVL